MTCYCLPVAVGPDDVVVAVSHHPFGIHQWAAAHRRSDAAIHRHWNVCDSDENFLWIAGHSCCHWPGIGTGTRHGINIYISDLTELVLSLRDYRWHIIILVTLLQRIVPIDSIYGGASSRLRCHRNRTLQTQFTNILEKFPAFPGRTLGRTDKKM